MLLIFVVLLINAATAFFVAPYLVPIWSWVLGFTVLVVGACLTFHHRVGGRIRVPSAWPRSVTIMLAVTEFGVTGGKMILLPRLVNERTTARRRLQGLAILTSLASPILMLSWAMALLATS